MQTIKVSSPFGFAPISYDWIRTLATTVMPDVQIGEVGGFRGGFTAEVSRLPTEAEVTAIRAALIENIIAIETVD